MLYRYNDIVAVNDILDEPVGIGIIVDLTIDGANERYCVRFNSGNPTTINRRFIRKLYTLRGDIYEGFAYRIRDVIRHLNRGKYMTEQEFEKYRNEWLKSREYLAPSKKPYYCYEYRYDPKFMDVASMYPVKSSLKALGELNRKEVERIEASPIKFDIDDGIKKEINNMVNKVNKGFGVAALAYKKIIFNGPCTIILWADGTKTIAKLYEDIDKFDPEKGVAICFMKKMIGHTETNKILRKATKQYADETTIKEDTITLKSCQETLKSIADRLSEPLISFNKEDKE